MRPRILSSCHRLIRAARSSGFAVCVLFLTALSAAIGPQFSRASDPSRQNMLADLLRYMRTQVQVYRGQHAGRAPGQAADGSYPAPDAAIFVAQMTRYTDEAGNLLSPQTKQPVFGPYLSAIPANPFTLQNGILIVPSATFPLPDDSQPYGWMYSPSTGRLVANVAGDDPDGVPYTNY